MELTVSTAGPLAVGDGGDRARRDHDALEQVEVGAEGVGHGGLDRVGVGHGHHDAAGVPAAQPGTASTMRACISANDSPPGKRKPLG